ncbi:uncharacterized protein LOC111432455 [Cucurbita moschata]|uniref:Uncharacterized protein LOC111432455 n=1 Tax=Cucurbita moschata TaxID=3662 RepID=A0A6J1EBB0_CUCMO|nr:uncharacterized protein LOC111432455 [Cucurbita moschata]
MGDLRFWSLEQNGAVAEDKPSSSSSFSSLLPSNPEAIDADYWRRAEEVTQAIIWQVQPTVVSERRREAVIDYVQRLLRGHLQCEVFPFGSVPLKTYLPDGDIDLTALVGSNLEDALASDVCSVLNSEEQNGAAEFVVKDVQLIRAEVKLVKCLVQNIVVDISFNQLGGLSTLCFLEKIDHRIGKDNLFKRSIILIKAWCYYESRILGAHHGLISTYALETLVLYIFHLFHSALNGPLEVLYKFLDYFSKFDWDNYCISLNGPVRLSSLPEFVVETPENGGGDLLLGADFLNNCLERLSVPARGNEANSRAFPIKHLNIVDPLKENNNLGRSVSKGNFYRIRSAFSFGARKLGFILSRPEENIVDEVCNFFFNTLDRHGGGQRPDVQDSVPVSGGYESCAALLASGTEAQKETNNSNSGSVCDSETTGEYIWSREISTHGVNGNDKASGKYDHISCIMTESSRRRSVQVGPLSVPSGVDSLANAIGVSDYRLSGDANDLASLRIEGVTISQDANKSSPSSFGEGILPLVHQSHRAPHRYCSRPIMENGELKDEHTNKSTPENSELMEKDSSCQHLQSPTVATVSSAQVKQDGNHMIDEDDVANKSETKQCSPSSNSFSFSSEDFYPRSCRYRFLTRPPETNALSDLNGDYESHFNSLQIGRWYYDYASSAPLSPIPPPLPSQYPSKNAWDIIRRSVQVKQNPFAQINSNGLIPRTAFYPIRSPILTGGATLGMEEMPKPRGTGTYFPNMNHYRDRPPSARGRNQVPVRSPRNNGQSLTPLETTVPEKSGQDLHQVPTANHGGGILTSSGSPVRRANHNGNVAMPRPDRAVEFGSFGHLQLESTVDCSGEPSQVSALLQNPAAALNISSPKTQKAKQTSITDQDRLSVHMQSYELKDEEDFPPLSN